MQQKSAIFLISIMIFFISSCTSSNNVPIDKSSLVCNKPYIQNNTGCCLDIDTNTICDDSEKQSQKFEEQPEKKQENIEQKEIVDEKIIEEETEDENFDPESVLDSVVLIKWGEGSKEVQGSGFFVSPENIITNSHVFFDYIESDFTNAHLITSSGKKITNISLVGYNFDHDLALLKVKGEEGFPYLEFEDHEKIKVGDKVYAIGSPYGFNFSISTGIVSGIRKIEDYIDSTLIQTDAEINPGNSGGPLINTKGKVVGVNTFKFFGDEFEKLGFAVSSENVGHFVNTSLKIKCSTSGKNSFVFALCNKFEQYDKNVTIYRSGNGWIERRKGTEFGISEDLLFYKLEDLKIVNKAEQNYTFCFDIAGIKWGYDEIHIPINDTMTVLEGNLKYQTIFINWWDLESKDDEISDYYFEFDVFECNTSKPFYKYYVRGLY